MTTFQIGDIVTDGYGQEYKVFTTTNPSQDSLGKHYPIGAESSDGERKYYTADGVTENPAEEILSSIHHYASTEYTEKRIKELLAQESTAKTTEEKQQVQEELYKTYAAYGKLKTKQRPTTYRASLVSFKRMLVPTMTPS